MQEDYYSVLARMIDASGNILKSFGDGMFAQAHGFCRDRDGNFWAGDSGPFTDTPASAGPTG